MKKVLAVLLATVLALSLMTCGAAASVSAQTVTTAPYSGDPVYPAFALYDAYGLPGGEITVPLYIENNPGIVTFQWDLTYDAEYLELISVEEQIFAGLTYSALDVAPLSIEWTAQENVNNYDDGVVAYFTFRIKETAPLSKVYLQLSSASEENVFNADGHFKGFTRQFAYANIVEYLAGDLNGDGKINNRDLGMLTQWMNGVEISVDERTADTNGDDKVNNRDLGLLQQYLNGWDVSLVHPMPPAPPEPPVSPEEEFLSQVPEDLSGQKIKMMAWWFPSAEDTAKVDTFYKETGIKVTFETATLDKYQSTLAGKIMAGNPPQTAAIRSDWYPQPITRGLMQPIESTGWDYNEDIYSKEMMDAFAYKGQRYGIALKGSLFADFEVLYFNETLLKAKGVEKTPYDLWKEGNWNWLTLMEMAQQYKNAADGNHALTLPSHSTWMLSAGYDFVEDSDTGLKSTVNDAHVIDAWNHAWDMVHTYDVVTATFDEQLFYHEAVAMMSGTTAQGLAVAAACDFQLGVVPFPTAKGQKAVSACTAAVWGFPVKNTGNKLQAAMWWLRYYLDDAAFTDREAQIGAACVEVLDGMWQERIKPFTSVGVISYGNVCSMADIEYSIIQEATNKAMVLTKLQSWKQTLDTHIHDVENT